MEDSHPWVRGRLVYASRSEAIRHLEHEAASKVASNPRFTEYELYQKEDSVKAALYSSSTFVKALTAWRGSYVETIEE